MPSFVTGEGEPYRPNILLWMGPDGALLGTQVARANEILELATASLRTAIEQPLHGKPHTPDRIRVASDHLAKAARVGHPNIDFVVAPTPELDTVVESMRDYFTESPDEPASYLDLGAGPGGEANPEAVGAFFDAAAALYRTQPWNVVPSDIGRIAVTVESHGIEDGVILVVGQAGESFGILLFREHDDVRRYAEAGEAFARGEEPDLPVHGMLSFDVAADLHPKLVAEVKTHRWKVAGPAGYPWLAYIDRDRSSRPPSARELSLFEAICRALAKLMRSKSKLAEAWDGGPEVQQTVHAKTRAGPITVTLTCPHPEDAQATEATDAMSEQAAAAHGLLDHVLLHHYEASKEARARGGSDFCQLVVTLSADRFGLPLATLSAAQLRELIFEFLPRQVSMDANAASDIIEDLRAFARYLSREYGRDCSVAWLDVLDDDATARLEAALSNADNFGPAKALIMAGRAAGFAMDSPEDIEAFMRTGLDVPSSDGQPGFLVPLGDREAAPARPQKPRAKSKKTKRRSKSKRRKG